MTMRIDSHVHFWNIDVYDSSWMTGDFAPLRRSFLPTDLEPELAKCGVDGAIFVQAQHVREDNDWVLGFTETHPFVRGVVGWVDLTAADVEDDVRRFLEHDKACGIRHLTHNEPDDDWIVRPDWIVA